MNNITAIIITKNEEKMIGDCLKSLAFVDKIIVVDSNSDDRTRDIAKDYGAEIYSHNFTDFSDSRNFALSKVKTDWLIYIDADERINSDLQQEIIVSLLDTSVGAIGFLRRNYYFGKSWPYLEEKIRLFPKKNLIRWEGELHESPKYLGRLKMIKGELLHYTHRNIEDMLNKTIEWSKVEAKLRFKENHSKITWWRLIRVYVTGFWESYVKQKGYKVGSVGLIESLYQGFSMFITYTKLWEMQNKTK